MWPVSRRSPRNRSQGIQRYGFHGLSLESIVRQLGNDLPERVVIAHLGNGASITAVRGGQSIDTSMGLTPTGGVIMATQRRPWTRACSFTLCGRRSSMPPGSKSWSIIVPAFWEFSGLSSDMRQLHEAVELNPDARLAIEMFCHSVRKQIAAMIAVLDGLDLLVFTGGIGENDAQVRAAICGGLTWMGVSLDASRNRAAGKPINDGASCCSVQVLALTRRRADRAPHWSFGPTELGLTGAAYVPLADRRRDPEITRLIDRLSISAAAWIVRRWGVKPVLEKCRPPSAHRVELPIAGASRAMSRFSSAITRT